MIFISTFIINSMCLYCLGCSVTVVESTAAFINEEEKVGDPTDPVEKVRLYTN